MKNTLSSLIGLFLIFSSPVFADFNPEGPLPLRAHDVGIGKRISDFTFTDLDGEPGMLSEYAGKTLVIAINLVDCPVGRKEVANLERIKTEFQQKDVAFLMLGIKQMDAAELKKAVGELGITYRYVADPDRKLAGYLNPRTSTDIFVLDSTRTLVYRGPVDDQYGIGYSLPAPRNEYLKDALNAVLDKRMIDEPALSSPGCAIKTQAPVIKEPVTFHNQIERLTQQYCQRCHRPGEAGPFSLITYKDVTDHAPMIEYVLGRNIMPPWFAAPSKQVWANDPTLSPEEKTMILDWIKNGAPEGDVKDAPLPMNWVTGWAIGQPDAVITLDKPISVPASGVMPYQYVQVDTNFPDDMWVTATEIRNSSPQVVHHVLVLFDHHADDGGIDGFFAARVPGNSSRVFPQGIAKKLPKGQKLVFQLHYTPNGVATTDLPTLGLKFTKTPPDKELETKAAYNATFLIPAGDPNYTVTAERTFNKDFHMLGFMPHMHLRGKSFKYELVDPAGNRRTLLDVPRYDFNWQLAYLPLNGIDIEKGSKLIATAVFDNSAGNKANPDPKKDVSYGEQTTDEMMIGYFDGYEK